MSEQETGTMPSAEWHTMTREAFERTRSKSHQEWREQYTQSGGNPDEVEQVDVLFSYGEVLEVFTHGEIDVQAENTRLCDGAGTWEETIILAEYRQKREGKQCENGCIR